jgi:hypothetical protein
MSAKTNSLNDTKEEQIRKLHDYLQIQKKLIQALSISCDNGMTRVYGVVKTSS